MISTKLIFDSAGSKTNKQLEIFISGNELKFSNYTLPVANIIGLTYVSESAQKCSGGGWFVILIEVLIQF
jgi:hypothetical protein